MHIIVSNLNQIKTKYANKTFDVDYPCGRTGLDSYKQKSWDSQLHMVSIQLLSDDKSS